MQKEQFLHKLNLILWKDDKDMLLKILHNYDNDAIH